MFTDATFLFSLKTLTWGFCSLKVTMWLEELHSFAKQDSQMLIFVNVKWGFVGFTVSGPVVIVVSQLVSACSIVLQPQVFR